MVCHLFQYFQLIHSDSLISSLLGRVHIKASLLDVYSLLLCVVKSILGNCCVAGEKKNALISYTSVSAADIITTTEPAFFFSSPD